MIPRLPYALTDLRAHLRANNDGFTIDEVTAANGQTTLKLSCQRRGYGDKSPLYLTAAGRHMTLDAQLAKKLPEAIRSHWAKFLPEGDIDADIKLVFDGNTWQPEAEIRCLNVAFTYAKFPYRLEAASGRIALRDKRLQVNVTAYSAGQPVRIRGEIVNPGADFTGSIEIDGESLPFDEKLFAAMNEKSRAVVRELHPQGTFNIHGRVWRDDARQPRRTSIFNCGSTAVR